MISIILCSRNVNLNTVLVENIKKTIGYEYELIVIDNSENKFSIFEAYNLGIERSNGEYLCFVHDDVLFHTQNWGSIIKDIFDEDCSIGLIGIAGAKSKTSSPSLWWQCPEEQKYVNLIQHIPNKIPERWETGFTTNSREEVVVIDGVFMCLRKHDDLLFNKKMTGFHNYDLNISFEVYKRGLKIIVTNKILLEHFSLGNINRDWVESSYRVHKLYKDLLPIFVNEIIKNEIENMIWFINESIRFNRPDVGFIIWIKLIYKRPYLKKHLNFCKVFLKVIFNRIK